MSESADMARLVSALVTARSAIESVLMQVMEESPEPESTPQNPEPATIAGTTRECQHPTKLRMEIKSMGSHEHWLCDPMKGGCGYEYRR